MAIAQNDLRFDWCDKLLELREYYSLDECCNIAKKTLRLFKGAEKEFIEDVCSRKNSAFSVRRTFYPVYSVNATVTYTWDEETTEYKSNYTVDTTTHHTNTETFGHDFFRNIHASCEPSSYVGRNDERFYKLAHVADLNGHIYNEACVYSSSQLENSIERYANAKSPDISAKCLLNRWSVTVVFVPVAIVGYTYKGTNYEATINMHNGKGHFGYPISESVKQQAKTARTASLVLRATSLVLSGAGIFLSFLTNIIGAVVALSCFVLLCVMTGTMKHTKKYFLDEYGNKGEDLSIVRLIWKEILQVVISVVVPLLVLLLF